jgi:hypothetical protein
MLRPATFRRLVFPNEFSDNETAFDLELPHFQRRSASNDRFVGMQRNVELVRNLMPRARTHVTSRLSSGRQNPRGTRPNATAGREHRQKCWQLDTGMHERCNSVPKRGGGAGQLLRVALRSQPRPVSHRRPVIHQ